MATLKSFWETDSGDAAIDPFVASAEVASVPALFFVESRF
jgi:hypothetical protein